MVYGAKEGEEQRVAEIELKDMETVDTITHEAVYRKDKKVKKRKSSRIRGRRIKGEQPNIEIFTLMSYHHFVGCFFVSLFPVALVLLRTPHSIPFTIFLVPLPPLSPPFPFSFLAKRKSNLSALRNSFVVQATLPWH